MLERATVAARLPWQPVAESASPRAGSGASPGAGMGAGPAIKTAGGERFRRALEAASKSVQDDPSDSLNRASDEQAPAPASEAGPLVRIAGRSGHEEQPREEKASIAPGAVATHGDRQQVAAATTSLPHAATAQADAAQIAFHVAQAIEANLQARPGPSPAVFVLTMSGGFGTLDARVQLHPSGRLAVALAVYGVDQPRKLALARNLERHLQERGWKDSHVRIEDKAQPG